MKIISGKPEKFLAASPNTVLQPPVEKLSHAVEECNRVIQEMALSSEASKFVYTERPCETRDLWIIRGRENVHRKILQITAEALQAYYITTTGNGLIRLYKAFSKELENAKSRGVEVKIITQPTAKNAYVVEELRSVMGVRTVETPACEVFLYRFRRNPLCRGYTRRCGYEAGARYSIMDERPPFSAGS